MDTGTASGAERESLAARFIIRLMIWTLVCGVCVAPTSIIAARFGFDQWAILLVDAVVIAFYAIVSLTEPFERLLRNTVTRRMLWIGFGTRMVLSIPPLYVVDMAVGMVSVFMFGGDPLRRNAPFGHTLMISIVDALLMNALLWGYMGLVYPVVRLFSKPRPTDGYCLRCGYDLRASPNKCPECGDVVKNDPLIARLTKETTQGPAE